MASLELSCEKGLVPLKGLFSLKKLINIYSWVLKNTRIITKLQIDLSKKSKPKVPDAQPSKYPGAAEEVESITNSGWSST